MFCPPPPPPLSSKDLDPTGLLSLYPLLLIAAFDLVFITCRSVGRSVGRLTSPKWGDVSGHHRGSLHIIEGDPVRDGSHRLIGGRKEKVPVVLLPSFLPSLTAWTDRRPLCRLLACLRGQIAARSLARVGQSRMYVCFAHPDTDCMHVRWNEELQMYYYAHTMLSYSVAADGM